MRIVKDTCITRHITGGEYSEDFVLTSNVRAIFVLDIQAAKNVIARPAIRLIGKGAHATFIGVVYGKKQADIRITTLQHHEAPQTGSTLIVKSVLTDHAQISYEGSIIVDASAQHADAYQRNENLLISEHARAVSKPSLEILANEVRCTHGAVITHLNEDALWYMAVRGISPKHAGNMITEGFLLGAADVIQNKTVRQNVSDTIQKNFPGA